MCKDIGIVSARKQSSKYSWCVLGFCFVHCLLGCAVMSATKVFVCSNIHKIKLNIITQWSDFYTNSNIKQTHYTTCKQANKQANIYSYILAHSFCNRTYNIHVCFRFFVFVAHRNHCIVSYCHYFIVSHCHHHMRSRTITYLCCFTISYCCCFILNYWCCTIMITCCCVSIIYPHATSVP